MRPDEHIDTAKELLTQADFCIGRRNDGDMARAVAFATVATAHYAAAQTQLAVWDQAHKEAKS